MFGVSHSCFLPAHLFPSLPSIRDLSFRGLADCAQAFGGGGGLGGSACVKRLPGAWFLIGPRGHVVAGEKQVQGRSQRLGGAQGKSTPFSGLLPGGASLLPVCSTAPPLAAPLPGLTKASVPVHLPLICPLGGDFSKH